jgi:hypothetical protein
LKNSGTHSKNLSNALSAVFHIAAQGGLPDGGKSGDLFRTSLGSPGIKLEESDQRKLQFCLSDSI